MRRWLGIAGTLALSLTMATSSPSAAQLRAPDGWQLQASPVDDDLHAAAFLDAATGWIVAQQSGAVLHTGDGGANWVVLAELDKGDRAFIDFGDPRRGWLSGERSISYTEDGGLSWSAATIEGRDQALALGSLFFTDPQNGLALGLDREQDVARILVSDDGGTTWRGHDAIPDGGGFTEALAIDRASGTVLGGGFGVVYRSDDGGVTWQASAIGSGGDGAVRGLAASGARAWAVGDRGLLARSDDGGRSWQALPRISRARLRGVLFADPTTGWIVGDLGPGAGLIYETRDGGERWRRLDAELPALHRIVRGGDRLWVVGAKGTILSRPAPPPPPPPPEPAAVEAEPPNEGR